MVSVEQLTVTFTLLRKLVNDPACSTAGYLPTGALARLNSLRNTARAETQSGNFCESCFEVWKVLSDQTETNIFYLPPPYLNVSLRRICEEFFNAIFTLERELCREGGNFVLNGLKGVGKTTLLRAFGAITACLSTKVVPAYWTYEKESDPELVQLSPYSLYSAAHSLFSGKYDDKLLSREGIQFQGFLRDVLREEQRSNAGEIAINLFQAFYSRNYCQMKILFLLDEFTILYKDTFGIAVISQIREIARLGNSFTVMAASCFNVRKYIFPSTNEAVVNNQIDCPDLNCSLFVVREVRPLRKTEEIINYCFDRYHLTINPTEAEKVLHYTGGIGRFIHHYHTYKKFTNPHENVLNYVNSKSAVLVFGILLERKMTRSQRIAYASKNEYDGWMDNLVLYEDENGLTDFLITHFKDTVKEFFDRNDDCCKAFVFKHQRLGFEGGSTEHSNEHFLCRFLCNYQEFELHSGQYELLATTGSSSVQFSKMNGEQLAGNMLDNLKHKSSHLVKWSLDGKETGIDRIWWKYNEELNSLILYGLQIKTGKDDLKLNPGKMSTERAHGKASDCNDKTISGILIKAEHGFAKLLPVLSKLFNVPVKVEMLYILTNKNGKDSYDKVWKTEKSNEVHKVTDSRKQNDPLVQFDSFNCTLKDGIEWLTEVIPSDLLL
jgi:hypothetical protein